MEPGYEPHCPERDLAANLRENKDMREQLLTNNNTDRKKAGRPSMVADIESGESLELETSLVGVKWAEVPTRESLHVRADHGVAGKGGNGRAFNAREQN
jgi:hypothetical protein